jgi:radical SAM superfamily enzyme YgiQ (UPF0313 family)
MYKDKKFKIRPLENIKEDITAAKVFFGDSVRTIFLADGNSIVMRTSHLVEVLNFCYGMFPNLERVTSYGAARFILKTKSVDDLKELKRAGLKRIHMGLESGDEEILNRIQKGSTPKEMIEASLMIKEAGIELSQYVLLGIGGGDLWERHAKNTACILNEMDPDFIRLRTLIIREEAPLYSDYENGDFTQSTPNEVLLETSTILENLNVHSHLLSDHVSNYANIEGKLPDDKTSMLEEIDRILKRIESDSDFAERLNDPARCLNL